MEIFSTHFPIFTTHDGDGLRDLVFVGGLDGHFVHHAVAGAEVLVGEGGGADGLEHGLGRLRRSSDAWRGDARL